jgi:hypothetical protein
MEVDMATKRSWNWMLGLSLLIGLFLALRPNPVQAQQDEYRLNVSRDFGYSSGAGQVRGNFSASIAGTQENIQSVTYLLDGKSMKEVTTAPFKLSFVTGNYPNGWHDMTAQVQTKDGRTVTTAARRFEFVSADQESAAMRNTVFPLLGVLLVIILATVGIQVAFTRNRPKVNLPLGASRKYGINGGTICPKCHRPFALHWWAMNAGFTSKIDRCDFCGRYGAFKRASRAELATAEAAELQMGQPEMPVHAATEEEKMKEMLNESRYTDKS